MDEPKRQPVANLSHLAQGAVGDIEKLLVQHLDLLRSEVKQALRKAGEAAELVAAGTGAGVAGGILGFLAVAHLVHETTGLPLWACYGLVGGGLGVLAKTLIRSGLQEAATLELIPNETVQEVKKELTGATA